jgi:hypothetical protein
MPQNASSVMTRFISPLSIVACDQCSRTYSSEATAYVAGVANVGSSNAFVSASAGRYPIEANSLAEVRQVVDALSAMTP